MNNVIPGSFYDEHGKCQPETLIVSFLNQTLRIRLEYGARTSFVIPFNTIAKSIKKARKLSDSHPLEITVNGHYSNLQEGINITKGEIQINYHVIDEEELIGFAAPNCGKIVVRLDRLIPYMDASMQRILAGK